MIANKLGALVFAAVLAGGSLADAQRSPQDKPGMPKPGMQKPSQTADMVMKDIERTLGFVPQYLQMVPKTLLIGFWETMKSFEMNDQTKLDAKTKELIGLAVAAQIPCDYCVYYHTEGAKRHGATDQEVQEAIGMASVTRMGSTLLNGLQIDMQQYRRDVDRIMKTNRQARAPSAP